MQNSLTQIGQTERINGPPVAILYSFLNNVVVRLSREASEGNLRGRNRLSRYLYSDEIEPKSMLTHASEKAIESYFHLYHLLLCLANDDPSIANDASAVIQNFIQGKTNKQHAPDLRHLLIKILISDHDVTGNLTKAIIKEAITRNMVWMLDAKGQDMPELSFLETDATSQYRLQKTFEAGKTSYRLLMFAKLVQKCVAATTTGRDGVARAAYRKSIEQRCRDLFESHEAPPPGAAASLAKRVREFQGVKNFNGFLEVMEVTPIPKPDEFTKFLRGTLSDSVDKGYSRWALDQREALLLRKRKEPGVSMPEGMVPAHSVRRWYTFFPEDRRGDGGRGGQGDRGRGGHDRRGWRGARGGREQASGKQNSGLRS